MLQNRKKRVNHQQEPQKPKHFIEHPKQEENSGIQNKKIKKRLLPYQQKQIIEVNDLGQNDQQNQNDEELLKKTQTQLTATDDQIDNAINIYLSHKTHRFEQPVQVKSHDSDFLYTDSSSDQEDKKIPGMDLKEAKFMVHKKQKNVGFFYHMGRRELFFRLQQKYSDIKEAKEIQQQQRPVPTSYAKGFDVFQKTQKKQNFLGCDFDIFIDEQQIQENQFYRENFAADYYYFLKEQCIRNQILQKEFDEATEKFNQKGKNVQLENEVKDLKLELTLFKEKYNILQKELQKSFQVEQNVEKASQFDSNEYIQRKFGINTNIDTIFADYQSLKDEHDKTQKKLEKLNEFEQKQRKENEEKLLNQIREEQQKNNELKQEKDKAIRDQEYYKQLYETQQKQMNEVFRVIDSIKQQQQLQEPCNLNLGQIKYEYVQQDVKKKYHGVVKHHNSPSKSQKSSDKIEKKMGELKMKDFDNQSEIIFKKNITYQDYEQNSEQYSELSSLQKYCESQQNASEDQQDWTSISKKLNTNIERGLQSNKEKQQFSSNVKVNVQQHQQQQIRKIISQKVDWYDQVTYSHEIFRIYLGIQLTRRQIQIVFFKGQSIEYLVEAFVQKLCFNLRDLVIYESKNEEDNIQIVFYRIHDNKSISTNGGFLDHLNNKKLKEKSMLLVEEQPAEWMFREIEKRCFCKYNRNDYNVWEGTEYKVIDLESNKQFYQLQFLSIAFIFKNVRNVQQLLREFEKFDNFKFIRKENQKKQQKGKKENKTLASNFNDGQEVIIIFISKDKQSQYFLDHFFKFDQLHEIRYTQNELSLEMVWQMIVNIYGQEKIALLKILPKLEFDKYNDEVVENFYSIYKRWNYKAIQQQADYQEQKLK